MKIIINTGKAGITSFLLHRLENPRTWSQVLGAILFKRNKKMRHSLDTTQPLKKKESLLYATTWLNPEVVIAKKLVTERPELPDSS